MHNSFMYASTIVVTFSGTKNFGMQSLFSGDGFSMTIVLIYLFICLFIFLDKNALSNICFFFAIHSGFKVLNCPY